MSVFSGSGKGVSGDARLLVDGVVIFESKSSRKAACRCRKVAHTVTKVESSE